MAGGRYCPSSWLRGNGRPDVLPVAVARSSLSSAHPPQKCYVGEGSGSFRNKHIYLCKYACKQKYICMLYAYAIMQIQTCLSYACQIKCMQIHTLLHRKTCNYMYGNACACRRKYTHRKYTHTYIHRTHAQNKSYPCTDTHIFASRPAQDDLVAWPWLCPAHASIGRPGVPLQLGFLRQGGGARRLGYRTHSGPDHQLGGPSCMRAHHCAVQNINFSEGHPVIRASMFSLLHACWHVITVAVTLVTARTERRSFRTGTLCPTMDRAGHTSPGASTVSYQHQSNINWIPQQQTREQKNLIQRKTAQPRCGAGSSLL